MANVSKKTSGRYRLVCLNGNRKVATIICDPITGRILAPTGKKIVGADLETLDIYILKNFKNEKELLLYLRKIGYPVTETDTCYFAYQHDGTTKHLDLVYQNMELYDLAVLCKQYKKQFSGYAARNKVSSKELRKLISKEISYEELWKDFYDHLLSDIHNPYFYDYIVREPLLGDRAIGFITDYLNNEGCVNREQQDAFNSAKYYLIDTFTAYKPIRGMIVSRINYFKSILKPGAITSFGSKRPGRKVSYFGSVNPCDLISETQLWYLEDHSYFNNLSKVEQDDFILSSLGLTRIPWYERTIYPVSLDQVKVLEEQPDFSGLTYLEKIRYANKLLSSEISPSEEQSSYQKKKV